VTDPHTPGMPPGTDEADIERRAALSEVLGKEVWPADRDTLLAQAQEGNATDNILGQLRRLPGDRQFENIQDVARTLGLGTEQERF
jgi:Protein of unknown function (DUF2795)